MLEGDAVDLGAGNVVKSFVVCIMIRPQARKLGPKIHMMENAVGRSPDSSRKSSVLVDIIHIVVTDGN